MALSYTSPVSVNVSPPAPSAYEIAEFCHVGKIFKHLQEPLLRYVVSAINPDGSIEGQEKWLNSATCMRCNSPAELFTYFVPTALQPGQAWQFLDDVGSREVFVVQQMTWDEAAARWMWQLGKPDAFGKLLTVWRSEEEIIMRADRYVAPVAPKITRRGNVKCGCGSAAFQLLNALECFNPNCRNYVPEKP